MLNPHGLSPCYLDLLVVEDIDRHALIASRLLRNDRDPDGDTLSAVLIAGPQRGQLSLQDDGSFSYIPSGPFVGTDSFTYDAVDGTGRTARATVTLHFLLPATPEPPPVDHEDEDCSDCVALRRERRRSESCAGNNDRRPNKRRAAGHE